ncbi:sulfatase-like hydrolase/transferase [Helicobacter suis]|uniref:sulfatase-like hydrolase/transferase n=1 Tax=Helicobacter suis TaxID=104628 RepID=UPI0013D7CF83|nr:phosphoethanolamine transferase [Helicobacter suis]
MPEVILDTRFLVAWLAPIVVCFFSPDVHISGMLSYLVIKVAFYGFALFYTLYFLISFLPPKINAICKNLIVILSLSCAFLDFFTSYYYQMGLNQALIETLLATNASEAYEFFLSAYSHFFPLLAMLFVVGLFLHFVRYNLLLSFKQALLVFVPFLIGFSAHCIRTNLNTHRNINALANTVHIIARDTPLIKEMLALIDTLYNHKQAQEIYQNFYKPLPQDYVKLEPDSIPFVVLIIGESASKNFMGVYGYGLPNTPFLSGLNEREREREREDKRSLNCSSLTCPNSSPLPVNPTLKGNLSVFTDVIAPYASTEATFQVLLNYSDVENRNIPWFKTKNLIDIFKGAGYNTFWLDNQEPSETSNARNLISRQSRWRVYTPPSLKRVYDDSLIATYHSLKPHLGTKNFILFHLIGSHVLYKDRFPKSFTKFSATQVPTKHLHIKDSKDKQIVADYANSLYYTDSVLQEIFKLFEDKDALILYLSDHAQDIYQSDFTYGHKCSVYGVEIPFILYTTPTFVKKHPEKIKAISLATHKPFMSDDLIHSLLPLVGIHTKDNIESKNLFSPAFDTTRKRIFCDGLEYKKIP